jgi:hypothetical protein
MKSDSRDKSGENKKRVFVVGQVLRDKASIRWFLVTYGQVVRHQLCACILTASAEIIRCMLSAYGLFVSETKSHFSRYFIVSKTLSNVAY